MPDAPTPAPTVSVWVSCDCGGCNGTELRTLADPDILAKLALMDGFLSWLRSDEDEESRAIELLQQLKRLAFPTPRPSPDTEGGNG